MLRARNAKEFNAGLDKWLLEVGQLVVGVQRGLALQAFDYVVHGTPQWSGELAASWRISINTPVSQHVPTPFFQTDWLSLIRRTNPYEKGDFPAISYAFAQVGGALDNLKLGDAVHISNPVEYAQEVEDQTGAVGGSTFLRPVNLPVEMTLAAAEKYGNLGDISEQTAQFYSRIAFA